MVTQTACLCVSRVTRSLRKHASNTQPGIHEIASRRDDGAFEGAGVAARLDRGPTLDKVPNAFGLKF